MHELGIVFHIIDSLEAVGKENRLMKVGSVTLEIGEVTGVVDSYLKDCWKWAADKSDLLRGARLITLEIPAETFCEDCGKTYGTVMHGKACPYCAGGNTYLVAGNECSIKEIEAC